MTANTNRRPQRASARGVPRRSLFSRAVRVRRDGSPVHDRLRPLQPGRSELREYDLDTMARSAIGRATASRARGAAADVAAPASRRPARPLRHLRAESRARAARCRAPPRDRTAAAARAVQRGTGAAEELDQNAAMNLRILRGAGVPPDVVATLRPRGAASCAHAWTGRRARSRRRLRAAACVALIAWRSTGHASKARRHEQHGAHHQPRVA